MYKEIQHWRIEYDSTKRGRLESEFLLWFCTSMLPEELLKVYKTNCLSEITDTTLNLSFTLNEEQEEYLHKLAVITNNRKEDILFTALTIFLQKNGVYSFSSFLIYTGNQRWRNEKKLRAKKTIFSVSTPRNSTL